MSDLQELYQEILLDHNRAPRNIGRLSGANRSAVGHNPLCGDRLVVDLRVVDGNVVDARFEGLGCAISTASASLMTEAVKGRPVAEVEMLFDQMIGMVTGEQTDDPAAGDEPAPDLGKLMVFSGVREYPVRVKCATLAWHTLRAALQDTSEPVSTE